MEIKFVLDGETPGLDRQYIAVGTLKNFKGHANVEAHFFRAAWDDAEIARFKGRNLVGPPPAGLPEEFLKQASEEKSLACLLEAFTREEAQELAKYLESRYADQLGRLVICPLQIPVPLGVGALQDLPATDKSGFIEISKASHYPLPFKVRAYYELN